MVNVRVDRDSDGETSGTFNGICFVANCYSKLVTKRISAKHSRHKFRFMFFRSFRPKISSRLSLLLFCCTNVIMFYDSCSA